MGASILVLCTNRHLTGVTVTFYRRFGRFTGFRDGQGATVTIGKSYYRTKSLYIANGYSSGTRQIASEANRPAPDK